MRRVFLDTLLVLTVPPTVWGLPYTPHFRRWYCPYHPSNRLFSDPILSLTYLDERILQLERLDHNNWHPSRHYRYRSLVTAEVGYLALGLIGP